MAEIVNIFAKIVFKTQFDLYKLVPFMKNSVYNPCKFNALVFRLKDAKATFLILKTGNVIATRYSH